MSINLLGELDNPPPQPSDSDSFIIANIDVSCSENIIICNIYSTPSGTITGVNVNVNCSVRSVYESLS